VTMGTYRSVIQVDVRHPYFRDGYCRDVQFLPSSDTSRWLSTTGLIVRQHRSGIELIADTERLALLSSGGQADCPETESFLVGSTDPECLSYTSVPAHRELLSMTALPDGNTRTEIISRALVERDSSPNERPAVWTPLAQFLLPRELIDCSSLMSEPRRVWNLCLEARQCIWKYLLFGDYNGKQLQIVDVTKSIDFGAPEPGTLPDGATRVVAIRSGTPVPLEEWPSQRFQLLDMSSNPPRVVIRRLPAAVPGRMNRENVGGASVLISEIYVNR